MLAVHFFYLLSRSQGLLSMSQNFFQIFACSTSFHASSWKYSCSSLVYFSISSTESFYIVSPPPHYKPLCHLLDWNVSADYFSQLPVCWFVPSIDFFSFCCTLYCASWSLGVLFSILINSFLLSWNIEHNSWQSVATATSCGDPKNAVLKMGLQNLCQLIYGYLLSIFVIVFVILDSTAIVIVFKLGNKICECFIIVLRILD